MASDKNQWGQMRLKFDISGVRSPEGIVAINPWETHVRRSRALDKNVFKEKG
jgi:hypothetical protein